MYSTREEVEAWLKEIDITNYIINEDLTVDIDDDVDISCQNLKEIPIKFGIVNGNFNCGYNELTSLEGCPEVVNSNFDCSDNELKILEYFPPKINGIFIAFYKNKIKEEELVNFNCEMENVENIYSDFNQYGDVKELLEKVSHYKNVKKENELLKELSINSNNIKLNKKL